jgi:hypothetical protein
MQRNLSPCLSREPKQALNMPACYHRLRLPITDGWSIATVADPSHSFPSLPRGHLGRSAASVPYSPAAAGALRRIPRAAGRVPPPPARASLAVSCAAVARSKLVQLFLQAPDRRRYRYMVGSLHSGSPIGDPMNLAVTGKSRHACLPEGHIQ